SISIPGGFIPSLLAANSIEIAGSRDVRISGDGEFSIRRFFSGPLVIDGDGDGTLLISAGISNPLLGTAELVHNRAAGLTILAGDNGYTGATAIFGGRVLVNGSTTASSAVNVASDALLGGTGDVGGSVAVRTGASISPGTAGRAGTLTVGSLDLGNASKVSFDLGEPGVVGGGVNDLLVVRGALELDGRLNVDALGGFGEGTYRLIDYGGALTDDGLQLGSLPALTPGVTYTVQTEINGEVNLVVTPTVVPITGDFRFWDGSNTRARGRITGGNGVWNSSRTNWTTPTGDANGAWPSRFAIFAGKAGTVRVAERISYTGIQVTEDGYRFAGAGGVLVPTGRAEILTDSGVTAVADAWIVGAGGVRKGGAGILELNGRNTFSGGLVIADGRVRTGADSALGAAGDRVVFNGGGLELIGAPEIRRGGLLRQDAGIRLATGEGAAVLSGAYSGAGGLSLAGTGTVRLTARNTYRGGTSVDGVTLEVDRDMNLGAGGGMVGLANGGTLRTLAGLTTGRDVQLGVGGGRFDSTEQDLTLSGKLDGPGALTKIGSGVLALSGRGLYAGETRVESGELRVNTTLASAAVLVSPGAILSGASTLQGDLINAGTVRPGNSPGLISVGGDFSQASSGLFDVEVASRTAFDRVEVGGQASLDGEVRLTLMGGFEPKRGDEFEILEAAGGVDGEFARLDLPEGAARLRLVYDDESVTVVAVGNYVDAAKTANQVSVAKALDKVAAGDLDGDAGRVVANLDALDDDELRSALDEISPQLVTSFSTIAFTLANAAAAQVEQRLSAIRAGRRGLFVQGLEEVPILYDKDGKSVLEVGDGKVVSAPSEADLRWGAFVEGSGTFARVTTLESLPQYRFNSGTVTAGLDYAIGDGLVVGGYAGHAGTQARYGDGSQLEVNSARFGLYGTYERGGYYVNAMAGGAYNSYRMRRDIEFGSVDRTARSRPEGGELDLLLGGGKDWQSGGWTLGVTTSLQYVFLGVDGFTESGADTLNVAVERQRAHSLRGSLGGRVAYTVDLTDRITLTPEIRMAWQHEFLDEGRAIGASLDNGEGPAFDVFTERGARNNAFGGAGITVNVGRNVSAYTFYNPQFGGDDVVAHTISAGINVRF
ncbi:MAG: autotransporter domain-containing protein, partial [Chthoniobacterales bacterium]